jgi:hypothetical protein
MRPKIEQGAGERWPCLCTIMLFKLQAIGPFPEIAPNISVVNLCKEY